MTRAARPTRIVPLLAGVVLVGILSGGCDNRNEAPTAATEARDVAAVRAVLDRYVKAVSDADENALRVLWAQPDEVSYVNPMQRLRSWEDLQGFWRAFLKDTFTRRELKPDHISIHTLRDEAWAVFDWEFSGTLADGKAYESRGWETHVYRRTERGWSIVHIHYSVPASPPPARGPGGQ